MLRQRRADATKVTYKASSTSTSTSKRKSKWVSIRSSFFRVLPSSQQAPTNRSTTRNSSQIHDLAALLLLLLARLASAYWNIIHDCDEVFNYWEPLHYMMYGYGLQTWEYSAEFALRSWWYLLLHALAGAPVVSLVDARKGKLAVFFAIRVVFAIISTLTEWWLYKAVKSRYSATISTSFLFFLTFSSGMFAASAAFLPSSFTMYALTAAAAGVLQGRVHTVIFIAVIGVIWGWCVAGVAFLPYALWVLFATAATATLLSSIAMLVFSTAFTLAPLVIADRIAYGNWKASLWNFLVYNVAGGGQSSLYGVEGPAYYFRNGFNQLQFVLPLALVSPLAYVLSRPTRARTSTSSAAQSTVDGRLATAISPFFAWLAAITALPHKEERFLYVVYPLACLAAAVSLDALVLQKARAWGGAVAPTLAKLLVFLTVTGTCALSVSRTLALVTHYGAPTTVYSSLPIVATTTHTVNVCVAAEWYRFPSAFFLPGPNYRLRFLKSGFDGLLPREFDEAVGGTRASPGELNDQNREEPANYWRGGCHFLVTLEGEGVGLNESGWEVVKEVKFLDAGASPAVSRAFYFPQGEKKNRWLRYYLLRNTTQPHVM